MKTTWLQDAVHDARFGVRTLARTPGFAAIAILIIALGVGVNTAVFSVVDGALLASLPFHGPADLFVLYQKTPMSARFSVSYPNYLDWHSLNQSFTNMAAFRAEDMIFSAEDKSEYLQGAMISADLFETLGIRAVAGHSFKPEDDRLGAGRVAMIDEDFWRERFGSSPDAIGSVLRVKGAGYTVVGVAPRSLHALGRLMGPAKLYLPLGQWDDPSFRDRKVTTGMHVVARRKGGLTERAAQADLDRVMANLAAKYPENARIGITLEPLHETLVFRVRTTLFVLLGAVGLLWLIALADLANLSLVRSIARAREFAARAALGAGRSRLIRQCLVESSLLAIAGGCLALILSVNLLRAAVALMPMDVPGINEAGLNLRVTLCALGFCFLAAMVCGVIPALKVFRSDLADSLKDGARSSGAKGQTAQKLLVVAQMSLAFVLLAGAGLMIRSVANLWRSDPGFDPRNVLTFSVMAPPKFDAVGLRAFFREFQRNAEAVSGVESAAMVLDPLPLTGTADIVQLQREGQKEHDASRKLPAIWYFVGPEYFSTMRIPLLRGRLFTEHDDERAPHVMVVDENLAKRMFGDENPLGKRLDVDFVGLTEVVGIVRHANHWSPGADPDGAVTRQMYFPYTQLADNWLKVGTAGGVNVVARTRGEPLGYLGAIRAQTRIDSEQAVYGERSMNQILESWMGTRRFLMALLSAFAGLALMLACAGIYGVLSYATEQRTKELGIRMALGAQPVQVLHLVILHGARLAIAGLSVGAALSLALVRLTSGLLYGVRPDDPLTFGLAMLVLIVVAGVASYVPGRRAMRIDPLVALRG